MTGLNHRELSEDEEPVRRELPAELQARCLDALRASWAQLSEPVEVKMLSERQNLMIRIRQEFPEWSKLHSVDTMSVDRLKDKISQLRAAREAASEDPEDDVTPPPSVVQEEQSAAVVTAPAPAPLPSIEQFSEMSTMIERIHELEQQLEGERRSNAALAEQVRQLRAAGEAAEALEVRVKDLEAQLLDRLAADPTDEPAPGLDSLRDRLTAILDCWDHVDRPELLELAEDELRRARETYGKT